MGLSTHILDTSLGLPAVDVAITLSEFRDGATGGSWHQIGSALTDRDGRSKTLLGDRALAATDYRLRFDVGAYFEALGLPSLYPYVEIVFRITDPAAHYHIPLLLTANGYTTYRGS